MGKWMGGRSDVNIDWIDGWMVRRMVGWMCGWVGGWTVA